ncbi:MAG: ATP-binding protein [Candidatus Acidiferrales bacterium]
MGEKELQPRAWRESRLRSVALVLALVTVGMMVCAGINFAQRARYTLPYDGIDWTEIPDASGVVANLVWLDTPGDRAGIRYGDILLSINGNPIERPIDVTKHLYRAQPGTQLTYELQRRHRTFTAIVVAAERTDPFSLRGFLEFVGVLYLLIGLLVLVRRWNAPHSLHFYLFCLTSFVFFTFSYSGKFNDFDWFIYWADVVARLLQPALFLHFALVFPEPRRLIERHRWLPALIYLPGAILLLWHLVGVAMAGAPVVPPSLEVFDRFDQIEFLYLSALFLAAASVFEYTYRRQSRHAVLRQQMKWITRGTWLAILPFTAFYVVPLVLYQFPEDWMKLSTLALVFIPLTFGYAIVRYRLMDVDVIFRRGVAYTLATAAMAAVYFGVAVAIAQLFNTQVGFGSTGVLLALIVAAVLFQPLKDWMQLQLERLFYRERFDLRRTLEDFGRELASEVRLDPLLEKLLDRLSRTLPVDRMGVLVEDAAHPGRFRLVRTRGLPAHAGVDSGAAAVGLTWSKVPADLRYVFMESGQPLSLELDPNETLALETLGLFYLLPCRIQDRTIALLALGKTPEGSFLTSEDIELVETLASYIAIALENARLYQSLEQKAAQVAQLKDFSESILESTSVGLVAVDPADLIESWNSSMERLTGRARHDVLGCKLSEVFPHELIAQLEARRLDTLQSFLYKFRLERPGGRHVVTNIALTPLVSKQGQPIGRLLIFDDITERVQLEDQLMQAEKLSSIGLLAAGVAHEVNTPLAVISNYAQMLSKQLSSDDPRGSLIEKIVKQTFRASEIISGLLNFSRTGPAELGEVRLNRIVSDSLALLEPQLRSAQIAVETTLDDNLPPVFGDSGKLQQVLVNLLSNARDAMPQGGRLSVRTRAENSRVQVEVADTGIGIPEEDLAKIYDPFFTTKSTGRGTGLGLAITYGIIQEHHGSIQVRSQPGRGATFTLEFPVMAAVAAAQVRHHG